MSALSELLNSQPVSARQAADRAVELGIRLPYGTIAAYWSGGHGKPSAATLDKLAQVLPTVTITQLREAAWNAVAAELGDYHPPSDARFLDRRQRQAVDELIRSIVATRGATHADRTDRTDPQAPTEDTPNKARPGEKTGQVRSIADHQRKPPVMPEAPVFDPATMAARRRPGRKGPDPRGLDDGQE